MKALRKQETGEAGDQRQHLRPVLETVGLVVAPTTLLTSLLFFFGYMRSSALWDRFGLDLSVLGFSTQDYLLRGIDSVWVPLSVIVVTTLLVLQLHSYMVRLLRTRQHLRLVSVFGFAMQILGLAWFVLGVVGLASSRINYFLLTPLGGGLGVAGLAYGSYLVREVTRLRRSEEKIITDPRWITRGSLVMVCLFVLFSLFWAVGDWAAAIGRGRARDLIENLNDRLPGVTLYSRNNLHIEIPSVETTELQGSAADYRFRYTGLRLLIRTRDKYFLVPEDWENRNPFTVVLPDTEAIRVEFSP